MNSTACPVCGAVDSFELVRRERVPVHQNRVCVDEADARRIPRATLAMRFCPACAFCWNSSFSDDLMSYDSQYDGNQAHSEGFSAYLEGLARLVVDGNNVRGSRILEIGCGQGAFLARIACPGTGAIGQGFDPAYRGPESRFDGALTFRRSIYDPAQAAPADILVCRHLIEHIPDPLRLLSWVHPALDPSGLRRVYFETPSLEWILRHQVSWDFFYEHCSLFTAAALARAFNNSGFSPVSVRSVFGGQYLWAETDLAGGAAGDLPAPPVGLEAAARRFASTEAARAEALQHWIMHRAEQGPLVVWGAGAKGATLCHLVDPERRHVAAVVDVNPIKQGGWLPGTAHPIIAPADLDHSTKTVVAMNPNYVDEIREQTARLTSAASVIDLTSVAATLPANT